MRELVTSNIRAWETAVTAIKVKRWIIPIIDERWFVNDTIKEWLRGSLSCLVTFHVAIQLSPRLEGLGADCARQFNAALGAAVALHQFLALEALSTAPLTQQGEDFRIAEMIAI